MSTPRFLQAIAGHSVDHPPIWIMRQAGRYLPEYRKLRQQEPHFIRFCQNPNLAAEATLQPLERFDLDATIVFSDILVVLSALGLDVTFISGEGPCIRPTTTHESTIHGLQPQLDHPALRSTSQTIQLIKQAKPHMPLIGFAGSPWTVACYAVEGQSSKQFFNIKKMALLNPALLQTLINTITDITTHYLIQQAEAGADVLMLFDSWGGILSPHDYLTWSLSNMKEIITQLKKHPSTKDIPIILFSKGVHFNYTELANSGCQALGVDWMADLKQVRQRVPKHIALQGNIDPAILLSSPKQIEQAVQHCLNQYPGKTGHILNLGHGIDKSTPPEHVTVLIEAVKQQTKTLHKETT